MPYVHGYAERESVRLEDQAETLADLLHCDTKYSAGSLILEAGCGVGSQTVSLASNSPDAKIISVDISESSLSEAKKRIQAAGYQNVSFQKEDILNLTFKEKSFDHIFVCFVLEHLANPSKALNCLKKLLKPGGTITVIEGDHGSAYFYPDSIQAHKAVSCQAELQRAAGGNPNIGRELYPLLKQTGFKKINVSPRMIYADSSKPSLVEGFTKKTFTAMIEGIRMSAIEKNLIDEKTFDEGIKALYRTTEDDGVFCYTFFKAVAFNL